MKSVMKSVRMTDEVYETVNEYRGSGFNEKFENMVIDFISGREKMKSEAELLQKYINDKVAEQRTVVNRVKRLRDIETRLTPLVNSIVSLMEDDYLSKKDGN